jgi:hypothetical protein
MTGVEIRPWRRRLVTLRAQGFAAAERGDAEAVEAAAAAMERVLAEGMVFDARLAERPVTPAELSASALVDAAGVWARSNAATEARLIVLRAVIAAGTDDAPSARRELEIQERRLANARQRLSEIESELRRRAAAPN